eukprot:CAMPEP_0117419628 /NCGR_PEP_ID=MMETSP0758-20121206/1146_1 /TAXON_ID=63605 /ORGANISM="Percolomonas cosmopolitus, Strain AE-1 (ATCC 50343)" /LENGTH=35 /DNA_ID= /DNA_START= /DNA_END= /DNA_ORIENTATION=
MGAILAGVSLEAIMGGIFPEDCNMRVQAKGATTLT